MADEREPELEQEGEVDAEGRNPTQRRMDEEGVEAAPVDASWSGPDEDAGLDAVPNEPYFEPDVPLVAEVNLGADRRERSGVLGRLGSLLARRRG